MRFESLELADFGNRIPALTFEVIADEGQVTVEFARTISEPLTLSRPLDGLQGFSDEGGPLSQTLASIDQLYPIGVRRRRNERLLAAADSVPTEISTLPEPAAGPTMAKLCRPRRDKPTSARRSEIPDGCAITTSPGTTSPACNGADGRARPGRSMVIEFPGALDARTPGRSQLGRGARRLGARNGGLANGRARPAIGPGKVVRLPAVMDFGGSTAGNGATRASSSNYAGCRAVRPGTARRSWRICSLRPIWWRRRRAFCLRIAVGRNWQRGDAPAVRGRFSASAGWRELHFTFTECRPFAARAEWAAAEHHRHDSHSPAGVGGSAV